MHEAAKARALGVNNVALEVGDIEEALAFYGRLFDFSLRGKSDDAAFIDLGDQFLALQKGRRQGADDGRHFRDPWGNRIEIVGYHNIQFTRAPNVLRGMGLADLEKSEKARIELADKGMS